MKQRFDEERRWVVSRKSISIYLTSVNKLSAWASKMFGKRPTTDHANTWQLTHEFISRPTRSNHLLPLQHSNFFFCLPNFWANQHNKRLMLHHCSRHNHIMRSSLNIRETISFDESQIVAHKQETRRVEKYNNPKLNGMQRVLPIAMRPVEEKNSTYAPK